MSMIYLKWLWGLFWESSPGWNRGTLQDLDSGKPWGLGEKEAGAEGCQICSTSLLPSHAWSTQPALLNRSTVITTLLDQVIQAPLRMNGHLHFRWTPFATYLLDFRLKSKRNHLFSFVTWFSQCCLEKEGKDAEESKDKQPVHRLIIPRA